MKLFLITRVVRLSSPRTGYNHSSVRPEHSRRVHTNGFLYKLYILILIFLSPLRATPVDDAYMHLARAWQAQGNSAEVIAACSKLLERNPEHQEALLLMGLELYKCGESTHALEFFHRRLVAVPSDATTHLYVGMAYAVNNNLEEALRHYQCALEYKPTLMKAYSVRGIALEKKFAYNEAILCYQQGLVYEPDNIELKTLLAVLLKKTGNYEQALRYYDQLIERYPATLSLILEKAEMLMLMHRYHDALSLYEPLVELSPDNVQLLMLVASLYKTIGLYDKAVDLYHRLLKLSPQRAVIHFELAKIYLAQHHREQGFLHLHLSNLPTLYDAKLLTRIEDVARKTVLVGGEWLHEDVIVYIRYIAVLKQYDAFTIVQAPRALIPLLSKMPFIDRLIAMENPEECCFDWYIPLTSLPHLLRDSMPLHVPIDLLSTLGNHTYNTWAERMVAYTGNNIGLYLKSLPQEIIKQIIDTLPSDAHLYFLHPGSDYFFLSQSLPTRPCVCFGKGFDESADHMEYLAALMSKFDMIVTSDNTLAHLAGTLGCKTIVFVSEAGRWRWQADNGVSWWYPTVQVIPYETDKNSCVAHISHFIVEKILKNQK
jgi:tetratricopeptide (TPR) repeat protein